MSESGVRGESRQVATAGPDMSTTNEATSAVAINPNSAAPKHSFRSVELQKTGTAMQHRAAEELSRGQRELAYHSTDSRCHNSNLFQEKLYSIQQASTHVRCKSMMNSSFRINKRPLPGYSTYRFFVNKEAIWSRDSMMSSYYQDCMLVCFLLRYLLVYLHLRNNLSFQKNLEQMMWSCK